MAARPQGNSRRSARHAPRRKLRRLVRAAGGTLLALAIVAGGPVSAYAQAAAPAANAARQSPADESARHRILQSREWQDALRQLDDWLSHQTIYPADEVQQIRVRLEAGIGRMSAAQMELFLSELTQKLAILDSDRARDAQAYLTEKFAVASEAYARRIRQQLPDILSATPAQIEQRLAVFANKRQSRAQLHSSFEESRQQRLAANTAAVQARRQRQDQVANRTTAAVTAASTPNDFTPARDYFPNQRNDSAYMIPFLGAGLW